MAKANLTKMNPEQVKAKKASIKEQNMINSKRYQQNGSRSDKIRVERRKKYKTFDIPYCSRKEDKNEKILCFQEKSYGKKI